jgi:hypothetical protein
MLVPPLLYDLGSLGEKKVHRMVKFLKLPEKEMENRKQETGDGRPVNAPPSRFAGFRSPVSGFVFYILRSSAV